MYDGSCAMSAAQSIGGGGAAAVGGAPGTPGGGGIGGLGSGEPGAPGPVVGWPGSPRVILVTRRNVRRVHRLPSRHGGTRIVERHYAYLEKPVIEMTTRYDVALPGSLRKVTPPPLRSSRAVAPPAKPITGEIASATSEPPATCRRNTNDAAPPAILVTNANTWIASVSGGIFTLLAASTIVVSLSAPACVVSHTTTAGFNLANESDRCGILTKPSHTEARPNSGRTRGCRIALRPR
jgi:hypothetical protein